MNEGKRKMARNSTRRDGSKTGCPGSFFFPEGRTYSPPPKCTAFSEVVVSLPKVGPCALRGGRGAVSFSAENAGRCGLRSSCPRSCRCCLEQRIPELSGMLRLIEPPDICFCKICRRQVLQIYGLMCFIP